MSDPNWDYEIEKACDAFEAEWVEGKSPQIEAYLKGVEPELVIDLLMPLLETEIQYRRKRGDRIKQSEYQKRFPDHLRIVDTLFENVILPGGLNPQDQTDHDQQMLFGILALQLNFVDRQALVSSLTQWIDDKSRPLADVLVSRGAISNARRTLLLALVKEHRQSNVENPENDIPHLSSLDSLKEELADLNDPEVEKSLQRFSAEQESLRSSPATISLGEPTSKGNRFRILRPHASGGLGEVYVATDSELNREVALKQIQDRFADDTDRRARFELEAEVTGSLEHPGIVPVYGLGQYENGRPFYAMRMVRGDSLSTAIKAFHDSGEREYGSIEFRKLLGRFMDICDAIHYAHSRGVLHRDLKPGNIMLGRFGETLVVDWGLAKVAGRQIQDSPTDETTLQPGSGSGATPTEMGAAFGTPGYMSPEQASGNVDELGATTDVFSLGATLYCLLTGRAPFSGKGVGEILENTKEMRFEKPREQNRSIPLSLQAICLKAMRKNPVDRYQSAEELKGDIEAWMADAPVTARPDGWVAKSVRWIRKHRQLAAAIGLSLVLIVSIAIAASAIVKQAQRNLAEANSENEERKKKLDSLRANNYQYKKAWRDSQEELILGSQEEKLTLAQKSEALSIDKFLAIQEHEKEKENYEPPLVKIEGVVCYRSHGKLNYGSGKETLNETWVLVDVIQDHEYAGDVEVVCLLTPWDEFEEVDPKWIGRRVKAYCREHERWHYQPRGSRPNFFDRVSELDAFSFSAQEFEVVEERGPDPPEFEKMSDQLANEFLDDPAEPTVDLIVQLASNPNAIRIGSNEYSGDKIPDAVKAIEESIARLEKTDKDGRLKVSVLGRHDDDCQALSPFVEALVNIRGRFVFEFSVIDRQGIKQRAFKQDKKIKRKIDRNSKAYRQARLVPRLGRLGYLTEEGDFNIKMPSSAIELNNQLYHIHLASGNEVFFEGERMELNSFHLFEKMLDERIQKMDAEEVDFRIRFAPTTSYENLVYSLKALMNVRGGPNQIGISISPTGR